MSDVLRFIACGSVDDGKSTLIGRLLHDAGFVLDDQMAALQAQAAAGSRPVDLAELLDGLAAEREQGITIDVAYRYFATPRRKFIVADVPGHEQYTRNMVTGASTADAALLVVDVRKGIRTQTRRHATLCHLLGVRHVILVVNKMDLAEWDQAAFDGVAAAFAEIAAGFDFQSIQAIPVSAADGDNVVRAGDKAPWSSAPTVLEALNAIPAAQAPADAPFRLPVQWVNRGQPDFRGFAGTIASGTVRPGDAVIASPSGRTSAVARIVTADGDRDQAGAGDAVTLTLADEIDVSRGDWLSDTARPPEVADQFEAHLVWMDDEALLPGRAYQLQLASTEVGAVVTDIKYRLNVDTLEHAAASTLELNDIAVCTLATSAPIPFEPYENNRDLGGFILIDRQSRRTVGAGLIRFALRRAHNLSWQAFTVDRAARAAAKAQSPRVLWFTGLSGAGKSTIADRLEQRLHAEGRHTYVLDGDNVRHGLNRDLGFTDEDRVENIRRVTEVARLMMDAGLIVLVSFISPFRAERQMARERIGEDAFVEIHIDAPLSVAEARDPKGLYAKARAGDLKNFTGVDSPYEAPEHPTLRIDTASETPDQAVDRILAWLKAQT